MDIEIVILIALAALIGFIMGILARKADVESLRSIRRKAARLTDDEVTEISHQVMVALNNEPDGHIKIPAVYRREFLDEYMKYCMRDGDTEEDDVITLLARFKGRYNYALINQLYYILASSHLRARLYEKYRWPDPNQTIKPDNQKE